MQLPGPLNQDQEKQLKTIQSSAKHLLSLINDLLDLAKIESGKVEIKLGPVICQAVIKEVINTLQPMAEIKALKFEYKVPEQDVVFRTDQRALSQILLNLTNNAIKFTQEGSVLLELKQRQINGRQALEINVTDTGIGIRAEDQDKLFEAFARLEDSGSSDHPEGTGLGLYLSQKLAYLLGGRITFQSRYGQGSTFSLVLEET